jgi:hypothetical protein
MKFTKSLKMTSPKTAMSAIVLTATLAMPSTSFAFTDVGALIQRIAVLGITEGTKVADYVKTYEEWSKKWDDIKTEVSKYTEKYNAFIKGPAPADVINIAKVNAMLANSSTTPSTLANYYFNEQTACKQGSSAASLVGSIVVSVSGSPKARLEQLCIKQKELAAMATQENLNYDIIVNSYDVVLKQIKAENPTKTGERDDVALTLAHFVAAKDVEMSKHSTILAYIQNQSDNLQKTQRDVEMVMLRGKQNGGTLLGNAAQTAILTGLITGTNMGVKGLHSSRGYAN